MEHSFTTFKEQHGVQGRVTLITTDSVTGEVKRTQVENNLVMIGVDTGIGLILARLNADNAYSLNITHAEIGTGGTPPTTADTALETPVSRQGKATGVVSGNILTLQFFFADVDLPNGTYYEFGAFIDGTATIGTGKIFDRALFGLPYVKGSAEDTTVQLDITLT